VFSDTYSNLKNSSKENHGCFVPHQELFAKLRDEQNFNPKVIWDVGACVLHWTNAAKRVWPNSEYVLFEATEECEELFTDTDHRYCIGVFSDVDDKDIIFYKNVTFPGGNSYYMENPEHSYMASALFGNSSNQFSRKTITLDTAQKKYNFPMPDLLKLDVQGCELDILKGATNVLKHVKHLIVELQHIEYNIGAQLCDVSIQFIESLGFKLMTPRFASASHADADYHFIKL
jgi:FkbM family methyltransferase